MPVIESAIAASSAAFQDNRAAHLALIESFRAIETRIREISARSRDKFESRGQLLPRDRIALLVDRDSPFLEISTLAGLGMHEDDGEANVYGGGAIAGIGFIAGVRTMIFASDSGIKGGAAHPMGVEKQIRVQEIAIELHGASSSTAGVAKSGWPGRSRISSTIQPGSP